MWIKHCITYQEMQNLLTHDIFIVKNGDFTEKMTFVPGIAAK